MVLRNGAHGNVATYVEFWISHPKFLLTLRRLGLNSVPYMLCNNI